MKSVEIIGYKRANLGKAESRQLREEGNVPCVLYGGKEQVHFYAPLILFRELVYTNEAHFVHLNIEGFECKAIIQETQFHPVSEIILHADFLQISDDKKIKMYIPTMLVGQSPGVTKGGALVRKRSFLKVMALPKDMPERIEVDCSELDFHHSVKVGNLSFDSMELLDPPQASIAVVEVPRSAKLAKDDETGEATEEGATPEAEGDSGEEATANN